MATITAVSPPPPPPPVTTAAATGTSVVRPRDRFDAVLGRTVGTDRTSDSVSDDDGGVNDEVSAPDGTNADTAAAVNAQTALAALLAAGALVITPTTTLPAAATTATETGDGANSAATATTAGTTAPAASTTANDTTLEDQSRTERVRLGLITPQLSSLPQQPTPPSSDTAANVRTPVVPATTAPAVPTAAATPAQATAQAVVATPTQPRPGGPGSVIPAQAPVVSDLNPRAVAPLQTSGIEAGPVREPGLVAELPGAQVGDRPTNLGDRFAALAAMASHVAAGGSRGDDLGAFGTILSDAVTAAASKAESSATDAAAAQPSGGPVLPGLAGNAAASTAPAANPMPATPPPAVQIADGVVAHTHAHAAAEGTSEIHLRLDPPDLGHVRVHLTTTGDGLSGHVVVASDAVRQMIESQLPELRQRLEAAGVTVQQFSVTTDAGGNGRGQGGSGGFAPWLSQPTFTASAPAVTASRPRRTTGIDLTV